MTPEILLFALFATLSIACAIGVVLIRDPVKAAMSLIGCFFSIACLYLIQRAELIGVLEVLVYAGAIMVLFVFVIMLVEQKDESVVARGLWQAMAVPLKVLGVAAVVASIALLIDRAGPMPLRPLPDDFGTVKSLGRTFFQSYLFHFEYSSFLLLVGILGAVIVSKRRR